MVDGRWSMSDISHAAKFRIYEKRIIPRRTRRRMYGGMGVWEFDVGSSISPIQYSLRLCVFAFDKIFEYEYE